MGIWLDNTLLMKLDEKRLGFLMTGLEIDYKRLDLPDFSQNRTVLEVQNLTLPNRYESINFLIKRRRNYCLVSVYSAQVGRNCALAYWNHST